ncbi:DNA topoisomerase 3-beta-1, partial [Branchiostoma belcheri]
GKYGDLDSSLISFGPCQTPTLGFCVDRHDQIQSFKPETYWVIQLQVSGKNNSPIWLDWDRVRLFDREVAQTFLNIVKAAKEARVVSVTKKEKAKQRPIALNTVELLRVASSSLGMAPQHTMQVAERLYTQGYISYPRTETTHYPENFDLKGTLKQQTGNSSWGPIVRELLDKGIQKPRKGADAGDHPPITPMKSATESELGGEGWRLYEYITSHFIATLSKDCKYLQTTVRFDAAGESFSVTGKTLIDAGYTAVMHWQAISAEESVPHFEKGDTCTVNEVKLAEKQTSPPDYLTEAELISLMEKHGIGTDASIPVHINNICQRNYVTVGGGRKLIPTPLGIVLVHGYQKACGMSTGISLTHIYAHIPGTLKTCLLQMALLSVTPRLVYYTLRGGVYCICLDLTDPLCVPVILCGFAVTPQMQQNWVVYVLETWFLIDPELVLPHMRSAVETQLNLIAQGKANFHAVLQHALDIFRLKFHYFVDSISDMDQLFEVSFSPLAASGKPLSRCGKCRRFMKYVQAKPSRLHCATCDETYNLPQGGTVKLYKEIKCPLDEFELVLFSTGSKGKTYPLCPYCFNHPPFPDMKKAMGCNQCTHPTCTQSLINNGVAQCVECEDGVLVMDQTSAPKWKMACNKCNVVINVFENAHKVSVSASEDCEECGASIIDVDFNKAKSPLEGGETQHSGCIFCDPLLTPLIERHYAATRHPNAEEESGNKRQPWALCWDTTYVNVYSATLRHRRR